MIDKYWWGHIILRELKKPRSDERGFEAWGIRPSTATTAQTICAWFTAEGFAVAHDSFCGLDAALTVGVALALDEIGIHGGDRNGTAPFYS